MFPADVFQILDANANRAIEGLRVVEEYLRFVRGDAVLTGALKQLRHELAADLELLDPAARLAARSTHRDVGTELSTAREGMRRNSLHVAVANLKRVQEALRVLEEYAKLAAPELAQRCERLRYRTYAIEQSMLGGLAPVASRLAEARLYVLVDGLTEESEFARRASALIEAGVHVLQLRDKRLSDRRLLARARRLRELTRGTSTLLIVNDRPDIAVLADADGVHVGQDELALDDVRRLVGPRLAVGVSTHTAEQIREAVLGGADYLGCGPTFPSQTKSFYEFAGLELLRAAAEQTSVPAFAIGGIDRHNLPQVLATGVRRIAVQQAVWGAGDPAAAAREFLTRLNDAELLRLGTL